MSKVNSFKTKEPKKKSFKDFEKDFHKKTSRHILELELLSSPRDKFKLFEISNNLRLISNQATGIVNSRLAQLNRCKKYKNLKLLYFNLSSKINKLDANKEEDKLNLENLNAELNTVKKDLNNLIQLYKLDWTSIRTLGIELNNKKSFKINSIYVLSEMENLYKGVEKVLYSDGKKLHFKKKGVLPSLRAKQNKRGIVPFIDKDNKLKVKVGNQKGDKQLLFNLKYKNKDQFVLDELDLIKKYISDPCVNKNIIDEFIKNNTIQDTFRICYVQIVFKEIRGVVRVFAQFVIEGNPCPKKDKLGNPRHIFKKGLIGLDEGISTFAVVSEDTVFMKNLAERNNKSTLLTEKKESFYLRKMDSSRRANNPDNYNLDGTIKKDSKNFKKTWKNSKNYKKYAYRYREINRKNALSRKYALREDSNYLRTLGDTIITKHMNYKALQKKGKETKKSDKTIQVKAKDGSIKTIQKNKRKRKFARSIKNRCPGEFNSILNNKFTVIEVNTIKFKASQYDHKENNYKKKELKQRIHIFNDGDKVQRDIYSAFLLFCAHESLEKADIHKCNAYYDSFKINYNKFIDYVTLNKIKINNFK